MAHVVIGMDACHVLLGKPWTLNVDASMQHIEDNIIHMNWKKFQKLLKFSNLSKKKQIQIVRSQKLKKKLRSQNWGQRKMRMSIDDRRIILQIHLLEKQNPSTLATQQMKFLATITIKDVISGNR